MNLSTKQLTLTAMFTAIIIILSQLSIPMPTGVPLTLQTFAVAFTGYLLGARAGFFSYSLWIILGACGVPVFSNFGSGLGYLFSYTGGFLFGFGFMIICCGFGKQKPAPWAILIGLIGMLLMHLFGTIGYAKVAGLSFLPAFITVSLPYLLKDSLSVIISWSLSKEVYKRLVTARVL